MLMGAIIVESARCSIAAVEEEFDPLRIMRRAMTSLETRRVALRI